MTGFELDKCARFYVIGRFAKASDLCGYERELLARLEESKCQCCRGSGYPPYVGGDDNDPCERCDGTGFKKIDERNPGGNL